MLFEYEDHLHDTRFRRDDSKVRWDDWSAKKVGEHDLETALDLAQARARALGAEEVIVAGGADLYESLIGRARRMHLTLVDLAPRGSVHFPAIDWSDWLETRRVRPRPTAKDEATFAFVDFDRRGCLSL